MKNKFVVLAVLVVSWLGVAGFWQLLHPAWVSADTRSSQSFEDQIASTEAGVQWLIGSFQNPDGGFSGSEPFQFPSNVGTTLDAVLAIASTGYDPELVWVGQPHSAVGYLKEHGAEMATLVAGNGGSAGKTLLALTASGENPRDFIGYNFVISLTDQLSPTGAYNVSDAFNQSLAILGLRSAGETVPASALQWLIDLQATGGTEDGSWDDGYGTVGNADATAMAVMALVSAGTSPSDPVLVAATEFFRRTQLPTGGFEYGAGFGENANSTALVLQALSALGEDFYSSDGAWNQNGNTPLSALMSYQSESGAFQADFGFGLADNFYATLQAIPGVTGRPFPLPTRYEVARQAINCLALLQDQTSGGWEQFAGFGVNAAGTARAIQAIVAYGDDPTSARYTTISGTHAVEALELLTPDYLATGRGGRVGIVLQGAAAGEADVTNFAGYNLPLSITQYLSPTGEYDNTGFGIFSHGEAMLGLLAAEEKVAGTAISFLRKSHVNGDWGSPDDNGMALQVLGPLSRPVSGTFGVLHQTQQMDGGWGFALPSSINSTSEVAQGLLASGESPFAPEWSLVINGRLTNAADAVIAQQAPSGCWLDFFGTGDDPFSTTDAVLMLMGDSHFPHLYLPLIFRPQ